MTKFHTLLLLLSLLFYDLTQAEEQRYSITFDNSFEQNDTAAFRLSIEDQTLLENHFQKGADQILHQLTANLDIAKNDWYAAELKLASKLASSYELEQSDADNAGRVEQKLIIQYSKAAILGLLKRHNERIWVDKRPATVLWIALDAGKGYQILTQESAVQLELEPSGIFNSIQFPVTLPIGDLQDTESISSRDIVDGYGSIVEQASLRYNADNSLIMKIKFNGNQSKWRARWRTLNQGWSDVYEGKSAQQVINRVLYDYLKDITSYQVPVETPEKAFVVKITNIKGFADVRNFKSAFAQLSPQIKKITLIGSSRNSMLFEVESTLPPQQLVELSHTLNNWEQIAVANTASAPYTTTDNNQSNENISDQGIIVPDVVFSKRQF